MEKVMNNIEEQCRVDIFTTANAQPIGMTRTYFMHITHLETGLVVREKVEGNEAELRKKLFEEMKERLKEYREENNESPNL